jgi:hypothetical protein
MQALLGLGAAACELALSRFRLLEPHLERGRELWSVADGGRSFLPCAPTLGCTVPAVRLGGIGSQVANRPRITSGRIA